jgi:regulator of protease activity HflC (stomatin/prohibitin superfamily)
MRVYGNRVLKRIFGLERDELTGKWRKLLNEELNGFHYSIKIVRLIKSRRMEWAEHVSRVGERRDV